METLVWGGSDWDVCLERGALGLERGRKPKAVGCFTALGGELGACSEDLVSGDGEGCSMLSWQERGTEKTPWKDEVML